MDCKRIQDLILTDYLDDQMEGSEKSAVEKHIQECISCQEFLAFAKKSIIHPFGEAKDMDFSKEIIWNNIKEKIEAESRVDVLESFRRGLKEFFGSYKPAVVFASLVVIASIFAVRIIPIQHTKNFNQDVSVVTYVVDEVSVSQGEETQGYGTGVEQYFL